MCETTQTKIFKRVRIHFEQKFWPFPERAGTFFFLVNNFAKRRIWPVTSIMRVNLICSIILFSCNSPKTTEEKSQAPGGKFTKHMLNPTYALGFTIYENETTVRLTSRNPHDTNEIYKVLDFKKSELPFKRIAISSTTHAFLFDAIGASHKIVGMSAMSYLQDSTLKTVYRKNGVVEMGKDDKLNREIIIKLNPQILMVYPCNGCDYSDYEKAGIIVVNNAEYLEENPLGRAEWIKVSGLLTGKNKEAENAFMKTEKEYNDSKKLISEIDDQTHKPLVILGKPIDNVWYVPGNSSFAAQLIKDAGGIYAFSDNDGNNVKTQSSEWVLSHSAEAQFWIFTDYSTEEITLKSLASQNKLYSHLNPFKLKQVIVCNAAKDDYFGKAIIEPHILLRDLNYYFYSENDSLRAKYHPKYFKKLKEK
jgi:iron complex transport system substrate-binding protein